LHGWQKFQDAQLQSSSSFRSAKTNLKNKKTYNNNKKKMREKETWEILKSWAYMYKKRMKKKKKKSK
jgi:hypothetical protein